MKHWFLDTKMLIDLLTERENFWLEAAQIFEAGRQQQVRLYVASLSFSHIYYVLRKTSTPAERRQKLAKLTRLIQIVAVDGAIITQALEGGLTDFEDAIQYFAAASIPAIEAIVTRDPKGFAAGTLPVLAPAEALRLLA
ncbi:MAG: type II toxin-antitoxin system VapC family toxin [Janthinobacterium lividum]